MHSTSPSEVRCYHWGLDATVGRSDRVLMFGFLKQLAGGWESIQSDSVVGVPAVVPAVASPFAHDPFVAAPAHDERFLPADADALLRLAPSSHGRGPRSWQLEGSVAALPGLASAANRSELERKAVGLEAAVVVDEEG